MAAPRVRVTMHTDGVSDLLTSPEVEGFVRECAEAIADEARAIYADDWPAVVLYDDDTESGAKSKWNVERRRFAVAIFGADGTTGRSEAAAVALASLDAV